MEPKLRIIRKKKSEAENAHLDPLMRALKALHSAGAPESMTAEELERQRRSQEVLGKLTAPMTGMDYEEFALSGMSAAWTPAKAPPRQPPCDFILPRRRLHERQPRLFARTVVQARACDGLRCAEL